MKILLTILISFMALIDTASSAPNGERLYVNAKVFTADYARPYAEAVAIRGGRVVAVGSRTEVAGAVGADAGAGGQPLPCRDRRPGPDLGG
jgi:hypothetical protein